MGRVALPCGQYALVDDCDMEKIAGVDWVAQKMCHATYAIKRTDYTVSMHRLVMTAPEGMVIDHANGNGLDNRKCNLRAVTVSQNNANSRRQKNLTGLRGVYPLRRKFRAEVGAYPKRWRGRVVSNPFAAAFEYDREAYARWGECARLNFPCALATRTPKGESEG